MSGPVGTPSSTSLPVPPLSPPDSDAVARLRAGLEGRYILQREIGSGGMATVYTAEDIRHARQVAIKLLRPELSAILGGERFLNEIRVTAHLQHPHILPLLDSGEAGGLLYYIMPFVDGESLRARLKRERQLPIPDAVRIAHDVADALDYAHRHGVIHRDVKPENILLHDGRPMVADFGIALAVRNAGGPRLTETGLSIGTPSYMSPEQATGEREVDARSDIYSLGCVLYEMLAGEPPHTAPTVQALMTRVVTEKPRPIVEVRDTVPDHVADAVHMALAKLPADRFATAGQFAQALAIEATSGAVSGARRLRARPARRQRILLGTVAVAALAVGVLAGLFARRPAAVDFPPSRLTVVIPGTSGSGAGIGLARRIVITPDGERLAFVTRKNNGTLAITMQPLDAAEPTTVAEIGVTGSGEGVNVLPPPSNSELTYSTSVGVMQAPVSGGPSTPLDVPITQWLAWESERVCWYIDPTTRDLHRWADGSDQVVISSDTSGSPRLMQVMPDGKHALLVRVPFGTRTGLLHWFDLRSHALRRIDAQPLIEAHYTQGVLVYATLDGRLYGQSFDASSGTTSGMPALLASDVSIAASGVAQFAASANGTVAYIPNQPAELVLVDRTGATRPAAAVRENFHSPHFSPDGRRIAMDFTGPDGRDIWVLDLEQRTQTRVSFDRDAHDPVWTTDGSALLYISRRSGVLGVYRVHPGSNDPPDSLFTAPELQWTGQPVPGSGDLITTVARRAGSDIVRVRKGGRGEMEPVVVTRFEEAWPAVSSDGQWLAFSSNQSGQQEVYVRRLDGGELTQVSVNGGTEALWSRDGRELFYRRATDSDVSLLSARVETKPAFRVLGRSVLFSVGAFDAAQPHSNYDVTADGRTFVAVRRDAATRITVLQNVPELVRRAGR